MGSTADLLGIVRDVPLEGFDGIGIENLLWYKYEREIKRQFEKPSEEMVGDTKVVRGFPVSSTQMWKGVETFLQPMT